jgi:hypothetical protein
MGDNTECDSRSSCLLRPDSRRHLAETSQRQTLHFYSSTSQQPQVECCFDELDGGFEKCFEYPSRIAEACSRMLPKPSMLCNKNKRSSQQQTHSTTTKRLSFLELVEHLILRRLHIQVCGIDTLLLLNWCRNLGPFGTNNWYHDKTTTTTNELATLEK